MNRIFRRFAYCVPVVAAALIYTAIASTASAAGDNFCRSYATSAVNQQTRNMASSCGYSGVRWHTFWSLHYNWCRGEANWRANDEHNLRNSRLAACGA